MNPPLRILPGWCLGRGPLQASASTLEAEFLDLPGYGQTPLISDFASATTQLAAMLAPGSTLLGWSLGGMLALAMAAAHPDKVGRLILVGATASFVARPGWPSAMLPEQLATFSASVANDAAAVLPRFVGNFNRGDAKARAVTRAVLDLADPLPAAATLQCGLDWLAEIDLRPQLAAVACPVLIIQGEHDPLMPLAGAHAIAEQTGATLQVMPGCAHTPFLAEPALFLKHVRDFLK